MNVGPSLYRAVGWRECGRLGEDEGIREEKVVQLYKRKCEGPVRAGIKGLLSAASFGFSMFCWYYAYVVNFYAAARLIESGKVTFAEVLRVFYGLVFTVNTLSRSTGLVPDPKAKTDASSILHFLIVNPR
ncbi:hypothetical protein BC332_15117 [Capsicum chinense]|nr:hypothetical protein BC332_15117 [Capsicum chinense]